MIQDPVAYTLPQKKCNFQKNCISFGEECTSRVSGWGYKNGAICVSMWVSGFVGYTLSTTSAVQDYAVHHQPALCTTDLSCVPWCTRGAYVFEKFLLKYFKWSDKNLGYSMTSWYYVTSWRDVSDVVTSVTSWRHVNDVIMAYDMTSQEQNKTDSHLSDQIKNTLAYSMLLWHYVMSWRHVTSHQ